MKFYWDFWDWNGKWMNRWMKIEDVWYELYVMHRHSVFRKENVHCLRIWFNDWYPDSTLDEYY